MLILEKSQNHTLNICCLVLKSCKLTKKLFAICEIEKYSWNAFFNDPWKKLKRPHFVWLTDTGESNFQVSLQFTVAFINWYFNIIAIFSAFKWLVWYVVWYVVSGMLTCYPCVKSVRIQSYSGPYFPAFEVNTEWDTSYLFVFSANAGKCGPE